MDRQGVRYAVAGGVAVVLHGVVRLTVDLDLMVHLERTNLTQFVRVMEQLGYRPGAPVAASDFIDPDNRARWQSFFHPSDHGKLVDVFVDEPIPFDHVDAAKIVVEAAGLRIPVASIRHLKQLTSQAGRAQDLADIAALESLERME